MTDTEIKVTADLVRDLLQEQHPDLAGLAIREVAGGWGNQMWRLGEHWTVMTWVPGEPLDHATISHAAYAADTLAGFLQALHVEAPAEAPTATDRAAHPSNCADGFENFFQAVAPDDIAADVRAVWDDAVRDLG